MMICFWKLRWPGSGPLGEPLQKRTALLAAGLLPPLLHELERVGFPGRAVFGLMPAVERRRGTRCACNGRRIVHRQRLDLLLRLRGVLRWYERVVECHGRHQSAAELHAAGRRCRETATGQRL